MANYRIVTATAFFSNAYKSGNTLNGAPKGIVIHSTGAENPNLWRWANNPAEFGENPNKNYFGGENDDRDVTPHCVLGLDKYGNYCIAQLLPYNRRPYGCGSGKNGSFNTSHIQIEIAENYGLTEKYMRDTIDIAADWCADLCIAYPTIDIDNIVSHKEAAEMGYASNHGDPEHWWNKYGYNMDLFRDLVREKKKAKLDVSNDDTKPRYTVQVGAFVHYDNAKAFAVDLKKKGIDAFVKEIK